MAIAVLATRFPGEPSFFLEILKVLDDAPACGRSLMLSPSPAIRKEAVLDRLSFVGSCLREQRGERTETLILRKLTARVSRRKALLRRLLSDCLPVPKGSRDNCCADSLHVPRMIE